MFTEKDQDMGQHFPFLASFVEQNKILSQFQRYLEVQLDKQRRSDPDQIITRYNPVDVARYRNEMKTGICNFLTSAWLYYKSVGKEQTDFFDELKEILKWNGDYGALIVNNHYIEKIFDRIISAAGALDPSWKVFDVGAQYEMQKYFKLITNNEMVEEFSLPFNYKKEELQKVLSHVIKSQQMVRVAGRDHVIGIFLKDDKYHIFDANRVYNASPEIPLPPELQEALSHHPLLESDYNQNEKILETIEEVEAYLETALFDKHNRPKQVMELCVSVYNPKGKENKEYYEIYTQMKKYLVDQLKTEAAEDKNRIDSMGLQTVATTVAYYAKPDLLQDIIDLAVDIHNPGQANRTPLMAATEVGNLDEIEILLDGKEGNPKWDLQYTGYHNDKKQDALSLAAMMGYTKVVKYLLARSRHEGIKMQTGYALKYAADAGHAEVVDLLLKADVRIRDLSGSDGVNALMRAAGNGHAEVVEVLLKHGAKLTDRDEAQRTPLMHAAANGRINTLRLMIRNGGHLNEMRDREGNTIMMHALSNGQIDMVHELIKQGLKLEDPRDGGISLLYTVAKNNQLGYVNKLMSLGLNVNYVAKPPRVYEPEYWKKTRTPLMAAIAANSQAIDNTEVILALLEHPEINVNYVNRAIVENPRTRKRTPYQESALSLILDSFKEAEDHFVLYARYQDEVLDPYPHRFEILLALIEKGVDPAGIPHDKFELALQQTRDEIQKFGDFLPEGYEFLADLQDKLMDFLQVEDLKEEVPDILQPEHLQKLADFLQGVQQEEKEEKEGMEVKTQEEEERMKPAKTGPSMGAAAGKPMVPGFESLEEGKAKPGTDAMKSPPESPKSPKSSKSPGKPGA